MRVHGRPAGTVRVTAPGGRVAAGEVRRAVDRDPEVATRATTLALGHQLFGPPPPPSPDAVAAATVAVCTRDRPDQARSCVESLLRLRPAPGEIVVVDNASATDATRRALAGLPVRYVVEPRPGLNRARATALEVASGELVLFTDDDATVDPRWAAALAEPFAESRVAAAAGLTLPSELETPAQELFERYSGFGRGFDRRRFDFTVLPPAAAGRVGAGANLAVRRPLARRLGLFDAELDAGTPAGSGGDTYALYRLLAAGYAVVYTPDALVWHRHRRDEPALRQTLAGYSSGVYAFLARAVVDHRDLQAARVGAGWFVEHHLRELVRSLRHHPAAVPPGLVLAEIGGVVTGLRAYASSRRRRR